jgi:sulfite exporter TauE/SafE
MLGSGFLLGFGHCAAMCGPVVGALALAGGPRGTAHAFSGQLAYHAGRLTTYALLGGVMGLTGAFLNVAGRLAGVSQVVAVGAGVLLVAVGLSTAGVLALSARVRRLEAAASGRLTAFVRDVLGGGGAGRLYPVGLAMGFLPCGASWTAFLAAGGTGSLPVGAASALAFGVGTLPALLLVGATAAAVGARLRRTLVRAGGIGVAALGVFHVLRGIGVVHG